ncbi:hypothetical protein [Pseudomonas entomophila]|uniref:hypothetical protein n=1 Tax=Pseudomonas entomophila TaxID=312306 RepID=UPI003EC14A25
MEKSYLTSDLLIETPATLHPAWRGIVPAATGADQRKKRRLMCNFLAAMRGLTTRLA